MYNKVLFSIFWLFSFIFFDFHNFINTEGIFLSVIPVVVYSDLETNKKSILKENKNKSGVYR
jgi:hypothetical protein